MSPARLKNYFLLSAVLTLVSCSNDVRTDHVSDIGDSGQTNPDANVDVALDGDAELDSDAYLDVAADVLGITCPYGSTLKIQKNRCATPHDFGQTWETGPLNDVPEDLGLSLAWEYENEWSNGVVLSVVLKGDVIVALGFNGGLEVVSLNDGQKVAHADFFLSNALLLSIPTTNKVMLVNAGAYGFNEAEKAIEWALLDLLTPEGAKLGAIPGCSNSFRKDLRLTPDGQVLARTTFTAGIVSLDPITGEINWAVDDADLKAFAPSPYELNLPFQDMGYDIVRHELIVALSPEVTVGIDSCGAVRAREGVTATVVPFGEEHLELTSSHLRLIGSDGALRSEQECETTFSLAEDIYACLTTEERRIFLTFYEPGQEIVRREVNSPPSAAWYASIASRDGILLVPSSRGIEFYDWRNDIFVDYLEMDGQFSIHDISSEGRIVARRDNTLLAIDSNLTGIAPGRYPRGFQGRYHGYFPSW